MSESTLLKMPHCWKSHVVAQLLLLKTPSLYNVSLCLIKVFIVAVLKIVENSDTVLLAKSDSDVMFCLQSYLGLIIDRSLLY